MKPKYVIDNEFYTYANKAGVDHWSQDIADAWAATSVRAVNSGPVIDPLMVAGGEYWYGKDWLPIPRRLPPPPHHWWSTIGGAHHYNMCKDKEITVMVTQVVYKAFYERNPTVREVNP